MSKIEVNTVEPQCGTTLTVGKCNTSVNVPGSATVTGNATAANIIASGNVVKTNAVQASDAGNIISQSGTTITLGASGDTITLAGGASQSGFGRSGSVNWDTTPKTATFTAVSGDGFFCNTTSSAFTCNLPAGSAGAIVSLADYAGTWQTNNLTVSPNGSEKIGGVNVDVVLNTEGQSVTFVYVDSTQGWVNVQDSTSNERGNAFIQATGGTITEVGDFKVHTFTGPGTFTVNSTAVCAPENVLEYILVAGGGGGGGDDQSTGGGGGGAGGFRFASPTLAPATYPAKPLAAPAAITAAIQDYPVSVGGGGAGAPGCHSNGPGTAGVNSTVFSLTSAGGGGGATSGGGSGPIAVGGNGGSGGGAQYYNAPGKGSGNTPSVSPAQGNDGGVSVNPSNKYGSGGGGGALAAGVSTTACSPGGNGGAGGGFPNAFGTSGQSSSPFYYFSGGGGGGVWSNIPAPSYPSTAGGSGGLGGGGSAGAMAGPDTPSPGNAGTDNTGGGGGGATGGNPARSTGGNGGSGIVIIRYKFQ